MHVPFVDLKKQYLAHRQEIDQALVNVFEKSIFASDETISDFEKHFTEYLDAPYCIACGNCTDALEIILRALEIQRGDEVIVPANGWLSAAEAVVLVGGTPVFADNHPDFYTIDPNQIITKITSKTKAIIPIHLYGLPADTDAIRDIAHQHNIKIIEDCAQSHGATYKGKKTGTLGDAAAFIFYPTKNLGAYGDAGAIVTHNKQLAEKCGMLANHGQRIRNQHQLLGRNSRMDTLQAAVLNVKLRYLDQWNAQRGKHAAQYMELLKDTPIELPHAPAHMLHAFHLFVVRVKNRGQVIDYLEKKGILTAIHYPVALPDMPVFSHLQTKPEDYPVARSQASELLSLPIYPELTAAAIQYVAATLKACCR